MKKAAEYYSDIIKRTSDWAPTVKELQHPEAGVRNQHELTALPDTRGRVLDIGCQAGHLLAYLKPRFDELYGLDIGDYSAYWAKIAGVHFQVHDVDDHGLPFPDAYFNLVTCLNVLEHVFDVFALVDEINRILVPGGHVLVEVPNAGYVKNILNLLRGRVPRTGAAEYPFRREQGWDGQHLHYFTLKELIWLLEQAGLKTVRVASQGRLKTFRKVSPSLLFGILCITARKA